MGGAVAVVGVPVTGMRSSDEERGREREREREEEKKTRERKKKNPKPLSFSFLPFFYISVSSLSSVANLQKNQNALVSSSFIS